METSLFRSLSTDVNNMSVVAPSAAADSSSAVWASAIDHKGRTYYYNRITRESRWSLPEPEDILAAEQAHEKTIFEQKMNMYQAALMPAKEATTDPIGGSSTSTNSTNYEQEMDNFLDENFDTGKVNVRVDDENDAPVPTPKLNLLKKKVKKGTTPRASRQNLQDSTNVQRAEDTTHHHQQRSRPVQRPSKAAHAANENSTIKVKVPKWKQQSGSLRQAMMAARGKLTAQPTDAETVVDDGLTPCPHCNRRFNAKAAERHIPKCQDIKAKPKTLRKGTGAPSGMARRPATSEGQERPAASNDVYGQPEWHVGNLNPHEALAPKPLPSVKRRASSASTKKRSSVADPNRAGALKPTVECPTCGRCFNRRAGERHIEKCKDIKAKPNPIRRSSTVRYNASTLLADPHATKQPHPKSKKIAPAAANNRTAWGDDTQSMRGTEEDRVEYEMEFRDDHREHHHDRYHFSQQWHESGDPDAIAARFDMLHEQGGAPPKKKPSMSELDQLHQIGDSKFGRPRGVPAASIPRQRPISARVEPNVYPRVDSHNNQRAPKQRVARQRTVRRPPAQRDNLGDTMKMRRLEEELAELDMMLTERRR